MCKCWSCDVGAPSVVRYGVSSFGAKVVLIFERTCRDRRETEREGEI